MKVLSIAFVVLAAFALLSPGAARAGVLPDEVPLYLQPEFYRTATAEEVLRAADGVSLRGVSTAAGEFYQALTPLMMAARHTPYPEVIDVLVSAGCDVDATAFPPAGNERQVRETERTALHFAVHNPNPDILGRLLQHGADPDVPNLVGVTALYLAASSPRTLPHFRLLIRAGAAPEYRSPDPEWPSRPYDIWCLFVGRASAYTNTGEPRRDPDEAAEMARALIEAGSVPDVDILRLALFGGQNEVVRLLLDAGVEPVGDGLLLAAVTRPDAHSESRIADPEPEVIELLLRHNDAADRPVGMLYGEPIYWACCAGMDVRIVRALVEAGARLNPPDYAGRREACDRDGNPPGTLLAAALKSRHDNPELVRYLLDLGISPEAPSFGEVPLKLCVGPPKPKSAIVLIEAGADPGVLARGRWDRRFAVEHGILDEDNRPLIAAKRPSPAIERRREAERREVLAYAARNRKRALHNRTFYCYATPDDVRRVVGRKNLSGITIFREKVDGGNWGQVFGELFEGIRRPPRIEKVESTPLIHAVRTTPYPEVVDILIDAGCDPNDLDSKALSFVMLNPNPEVLRTLLKRTKDLSYFRKQYWTDDATSGHLDVLVEAGVDLEADNNGTAIVRAARDGNYPLVRALIRRGVDLNRADRDGERALTYALRDQKYRLALEMIEAGADFSCGDGRTLLRTLDRSALWDEAEAGARQKILELLQSNSADQD